MLTVADLLDLNDTIAADLFAGKTYPWEALEEIGDYIRRLGPTLPPEEFDHPAEDVWIAKDAKVFPSAYIGGPCIIDHEAEIRRRIGCENFMVNPVGAVIGSHSGPGTVALFFLGSER